MLAYWANAVLCDARRDVSIVAYALLIELASSENVRVSCRGRAGPYSHQQLQELGKQAVPVELPVPVSQPEHE